MLALNYLSPFGFRQGWASFLTQGLNLLGHCLVGQPHFYSCGCQWHRWYPNFHTCSTGKLMITKCWYTNIQLVWLVLQWTNYLNPSNIKGLSAFSMLLAMLGNGLMIPRAVFIRDLMWYCSFIPSHLILFCDSRPTLWEIRKEGAFCMKD